jgi:hypothetical protein
MKILIKSRFRQLNAGKITAALAKQHAESEFEKFRPIQDRLFESDFDRAIKELTEKR